MRDSLRNLLYEALLPVNRQQDTGPCDRQSDNQMRSCQWQQERYSCH